MNRRTELTGIIAIVLLSVASIAIGQTPDRFIGRWALTIPGGGAGWLGIEDKGNYFDGSILWGGGSVVPLESVYFDGESLNVTRLRKVDRKDADGKVVRSQNFTETITATVSGDTMKLTRTAPRHNGKGVSRDIFKGKRIPPLPAKPDLSKAKRGKSVKLFNGKNLDGWRLTDRSKNSKNGWSVKNGTLINNPAQPEGRHISYGNLRTIAEFEDFNLKLETKLGKGSNSGIYLRGIYEIQVTDSFGRGLDSHNMAAVYSRITPTVNAEKPAGKWQTLDITLLDRHVTVILNGKTIINNEPLLGCTGGAIWADQSRPGPIYLQGDHSGINYRNIVLTPLMK